MDPDSDNQGSMEDPKSAKKCSVCGDKALGYNFNAITCESCKAFFRRNALKNKEFNCPFNNNCEVTVITRRFCQKCRLQKCFSIGMKKESILSEEEKIQKWQKIKDNRAKKQGVKRDGTQGSGESRGPDSGASSPRSPCPTSSSNGHRPQARVLPSTRTTHHSDPGGRGASKRKIQKFEDDNLTTTSDQDISQTPSIHDETSQGLTIPSLNTTCTAMTTSTTSTSPTTALYTNTGGGYPHSLYPEESITSPVMSFATETDHLPSSSRPHSNMISETVASSSDSLPDSISPQNLIINEAERLIASSFSGNQHLFQVKREHADVKYHFNQNQNNQREDQHKLHQQQQQQLQQQQQQQQHSEYQCSREVVHSFGGNNYPTNTPSNSNGFSVDNLDAVVAIAIKAEFHTSCLETRGANELNDIEKARLDELFVASRSLVEPVELDHEENSSEPSNLISVINMTDIAIKRIIRMAKKITPFIAMCQEDQIALLKGGCTELMILRSVINYDPDKNSWRLPSKGRPRELRMDVLKEASQLGVNLYEEHQRFVQSFHPEWRANENVMLLLSAIALFTPDRSNVLHKDVVKHEQDIYYHLLRRYLETIYTGCDSRSVYLSLIGRLVDLHRLNESHIQLFLEVNPKLVEPLLIEIFDLNPAYR